jgi:type I restriction-modification system DNA methylase subunit
MDAGMDGHQEKVQFIWSVAKLLRGPYRPWEYGGVILPFTVLRRLDCALAATKDAVLAKASTLSDVLDPSCVTACCQALPAAASTTSVALPSRG